MVDDFRSRGGSPWGSPPGGDGNGSGRRGPTPPDVEEIIRNFQEKIKKILQRHKSKDYVTKYECIENTRLQMLSQ